MKRLPRIAFSAAGCGLVAPFPELLMFSVYVPSETSLKKASVADPAAFAGSRGLDRPGEADGGGRPRGGGGWPEIAIPTREDMQEIEISSRLYIESGGALHDRDADVPFRHRYAADHGRHLHPHRPSPGDRAFTMKPKPFCPGLRTSWARSCASGNHRRNGADGADGRRDRPAAPIFWSGSGADVDQGFPMTSSNPNRERHGHAKQYSQILQGDRNAKGDLTSKVRERPGSRSGRVVTFLSAVMEGVKWSKDMRRAAQDHAGATSPP